MSDRADKTEYYPTCPVTSFGNYRSGMMYLARTYDRRSPRRNPGILPVLPVALVLLADTPRRNPILALLLCHTKEVTSAKLFF